MGYFLLFSGVVFVSALTVVAVVALEIGDSPLKMPILAFHVPISRARRMD